jgi:4-amino-4-deoxy-L-arabinose transferase-like glycosyltransferase
VPLALLYPVFFSAVYLSHLTLLRLPYFWDEGGYYIPAAWDFFRTGTLIPVTTVTNAHPPLPSIMLAGWWHLSGFVPSGTRTFICMIAAVALLAVYRIARNLLDTKAAFATTVLTGLYPVWFAQSTLAHADIFAAAFTLWGLSFYLESIADTRLDSERGGSIRPKLYTAVFFSLAALSKETAIVTPAALAAWEAFLLLRERNLPGMRRSHAGWLAALMAPVLPLCCWYAYHFHRTGFVFGNPEYLRYNATANLDAYRILLCLYHRLLHLAMHMNMFVPVLCAVAMLWLPAITTRPRLARPVLNAIAVVLLANWIAFSVLGGALLTRYLLPMYPLILLVCVAVWLRRLRAWYWIAALSAIAFLCGIWINPPYAFAPEDNLTYRDMIVLHQRAVELIAQRWPRATVLTAWPAVSELERPELGYTTFPIQAIAIQNFSREQIDAATAMENASPSQSAFDTALIFSTKWAPPSDTISLARGNSAADARYFDFHQDLLPDQAAALLHGEVVWQGAIRSEWVAVLRIPDKKQR